MPTDYIKDGTHYVGNVILGPDNGHALVFGHDGSFKVVTDPLSASPVEALSVSTSGDSTLTGTTSLVGNTSVTGTLSTSGALTTTGNPRATIAAVTNITTAGNETYTAAQFLTGIITRDPNGGSRTDATDTGTNLVSGLGLTADGQTAVVYLVNTADAAETITLSAGTDVTISNVGQTIAQNEAAILLVRRTAATTVTIYILGA